MKFTKENSEEFFQNILSDKSVEKTFSELSGIFGIDTVYLNDNFKRKASISSAKDVSFFKGFNIKSVIKYFIFIAFLLINCFIPKPKRKQYDYFLVPTGSFAVQNVFNPFLEVLKKDEKIAMFFYMEKYSKDVQNVNVKLNKDVETIYVEYNKFFKIYSKNKIKFIFFLLKNFFVLLKISKKHNVDFMKFLISSIKEFFFFDSLLLQYSIDNYISLLDTEAGPIQYALFKKYGTNTVHIQNAQRAIHGPFNMYAYYQNFFTFGEETLEALTSLHKIKVDQAVLAGSSYSLEMYKPYKENEPEYDICIVEEPVGEFNQPIFDLTMKLLQYVVRLSEETDYKIVVALRGFDFEFMKKEKRDQLKYTMGKQFAIVKDSTVIYDEENRGKIHSYEYVSKSKLMVGIASTLLYESIGFKKKALFCYYNKNTNSILETVKSDEELLFLTDQSYEAFKNRIEYLMDEKNKQDLSEYYGKLKRKFMNFPDDYAENLLKYCKKKDNNV